MKKKNIRIGSGAGYSGDRIDPAIELIERGNLDYIAFECLAERTIALAQQRRDRDPQAGFDPLLEDRMKKVLPLLGPKQTKVITNMGAANPLAASSRVLELARAAGIRNLKVATVTGDDVLEQVRRLPELPLMETGASIGSLGDRILSANAYFGAAPIVEALKSGADMVITGRVADPALFLAPMVHEFGWSWDEPDLLGKGTLVGHLLECAGQLCGGYYADSTKKAVPDLWNLGFPMAELQPDGSGFVTKLAGTGGLINTATCTEQLLYEIHNPSAYLTPDCIADFSAVQFREEAVDKVHFEGASGKAPTDTLKVSIGYRNGYQGEGQISYIGSDCVDRARLAADIVLSRLGKLGVQTSDLRAELIGINAVYPGLEDVDNLKEVRLRVCGNTDDLLQARAIAGEVEALYTNGPAGGGGAVKSVQELVSVASVLLPKIEVATEVIIQNL